ncbi:MAG: hypothetical protein NXI31_00855 [bacterium]|nr:hypothetical protein [bacterium]
MSDHFEDTLPPDSEACHGREAWDPALEARLRRDALSWGGAPPPAVATRFRDKATRRRLPKRNRLLAAAALLVVGAGVALGVRAIFVSPSEPVDAQPLRRELNAVAADATAIAAGVFAPLTRGVAGLFGDEGEK